MEMQQINSVFQIPVSIFDSPAKMVKLFQFFRRELVTGQVGNKAFLLVVSVAAATFSLQGLFLIASRLKAGRIGDQKKPHILRLVSIPKLLRFPKH